MKNQSSSRQSNEKFVRLFVLMTDPITFLKALLAPLFTNVEGEKRAVKTGLFSAFGKHGKVIPRHFLPELFLCIFYHLSSKKSSFH